MTSCWAAARSPRSTPEATYGLPAAEAPDGKVFNGWMLTCGDASLRWYAERDQFSYNDLTALCPEGGEVTARAIFGAEVTLDPTVLRAVLYYNDAAVSARTIRSISTRTPRSASRSARTRCSICPSPGLRATRASPP